MTTQSNPWTQEALRDHLQKAVYLEVWTIPIYLSAAYSLRVPGSSVQNPPKMTPIRSPRNPNRSREQLAFNNIYSVVVQEMLHLELACNLYNSLFAAHGQTPKLTGDWAPRYDRGLPAWIRPRHPVSVQLGAADRQQLALMAAIETPEPKAEHPRPGPQESYDSIGAFYQAIEQGIDQLFDSLYQPGVDHRQKSEFASPQFPGDDYTGFSNVIDGDPQTARKQADLAIAAIIGQGEGSRGPLISPDLRPEDAQDLEDRFSHYSRFRVLQAMLLFAGPFATYPKTDSSSAAPLQAALHTGFASLLAALEAGYAGSAPLNLDSMWALPAQVVAVWAAGAVPQF